MLGYIAIEERESIAVQRERNESGDEDPQGGYSRYASHPFSDNHDDPGENEAS
ncbi:hypothetical protein ACH4NT_35450 [Streptomyces lydicus]|uniref:hypothetical protein n=1 Tax=Streptomyces lydicus TaxID=47763 RepID=UPI0037AD626F